MENKTYGRNVIRSSAKAKYQRRLIASWIICFLIGFIIGSILMSGITHIFTCVKIVDAAEPIVVEEVIEEPEVIAIDVVATAYCACFKCCGKNPGDKGYGITKSGARAVEGVTIATDPSVIPLGTHATFDDHEYIAQDTGSAIKGNRIDVYFENHQKALEFGVQNKTIYIMKEGEEV